MTRFRNRTIGVVAVSAFVAFLMGVMGPAFAASTVPAEFRVWEGTVQNGHQWDTDLDGKINVFSSGALMRDASGTDVFAPGCEGSYLFTVESASPHTITYALNTTETNPSAVPIGVRLSTLEGTYIAGSAQDWVPADQVGRYISTLNPKEVQSFVLDWRWLYETSSERNALDTALGTKALEGTIPYDLTLTIDAETDAVVAESESSDTVSTGDLLPMAVVIVAGVTLAVLLFGTSRQTRKEATHE